VFACALALGQDDLQANAQRARQAMVDRRYDEATRLYSELARSLPQNPGMLMNLGIARHTAGNYREAIASFSSALKLKPDPTQAKLLMSDRRSLAGTSLAAETPPFSRFERLVSSKLFAFN